MLFWKWFQPISFQLIWLSTVIGNNGWLFFPITLLLAHFLLTPTFKDDRKICLLGVAGFSIDLMLTAVGVFGFQQWPLWLLVLWLAFVLNFGHSLRFLRKLKPLWVVIAGSIGGCYAYLASWKLGAAELPLGIPITALILAFTWAIILPVLVKLDLKIRTESHVYT